MSESSSRLAELSPIVCVIDDDEDLRASLIDLLESDDLSAIGFDSAESFLATGGQHQAGCILLDIEMPGTDGLTFQREMQSAGTHMPIVFMTAHATVPRSVQALKAGAFDFLQKPVPGNSLLQTVHRALESDAKRRAAVDRRRDIQVAIEGLTKREREVLERVTCGLLNKQIAFELGISEIMVKFHRGNLVRKMGTRSLPELVRHFEIYKNECGP